MQWFHCLSCFLGVMVQSWAEQQQRQCFFPQLPDHAKPLTPERVAYLSGDIFKYGCEDDHHFESGSGSGIQMLSTKLWCDNGQWRPARFWRCVDECGSRCVHGSCVKTLDMRTRTPVSKCVCQQNYAGEDCSARVCDLLPRKPHHKKPIGPAVHAGEYVSVESSVRFQCEDGYGFRVGGEWVGEMVSTCTATGWDPPAKDCEEITCSAPVSRNLIVSSLSQELKGMTSKLGNPLKTWKPGERVAVSCSHGCISDPEELTCSQRGLWSPRVPSCIVPACRSIPHVDNAKYRVYGHGVAADGSSVSRWYYAVGTEVAYTCVSPQYLMHGQPRIKCQSSPVSCGEPQWDNRPRCVFKGSCGPNKRLETRDDGVYCVPLTQPIIRTTVSSTVKPLTIVTATAGALLLLLLIVISLVAYQRRRIALAHRRQVRAQAAESEANNDRFSFVYYTNDIHVVLPSYDEAVGTGAPPPYASDSASGSTENVNASVAQEVTVDSESESEPLYEVIDETIHMTSSTSGATASATSAVCQNANVLHKELGPTIESDVESVISLNVDDPNCDDTTPLVDD